MSTIYVDNILPYSGNSVFISGSVSSLTANFAETASVAPDYTLSSSFLNYTSSTNTRIGNLEAFSASLDATFATDAQLNTATASLSSSINTLSDNFLSYTASQDAINNTLATTGSNSFDGSQNVTGSVNISGSIVVTDTITAQKLVVQTITSSVDFVTGSTKFGTIPSNTHQFTGSVAVSGSLAVNGVDYTNLSSSFDTKILNNSSSIGLLSSSYLASSASFDTRALINSASVSLLSGSYLASSSSFDTRISNNSSSISLVNENLQTASSSLSNRIANQEAFSSSLDATFATDAQLNSATSSLSGSIGALSGSFLSATASLSGSIDTLSGSFLATSASLSGSVSALSGSFLATSASLSGSVSALSGSFLEATASLSGSVSALSSSFLATSSSFLATSASLSGSVSALSSSFLSATSSLSGSIDALSGSFLATSASLSGSVSALSGSFLSATASLSSSIGALSGSFLSATASLSGSVSALSSSFLSATASLSGSVSALSSSFLSYTSSQNVLNNQYATTGSNTFNGNQIISGSLSVTNGITGSLLGTSSFANNATSASFASTASYVLNAVSSSWSAFSSQSAASTQASTVSISGISTDKDYTFPLILTGSSGPSLGLSTDTTTGVFYNPATNLFRSTNIVATGSLLGTSSFANSATSASYAANADLLDGLDSSAFVSTSSYNAFTSSINAETASLEAAVLTLNSATSSLNSFTSSQLVLNGTYALTSSNTFTGNQTIQGTLYNSNTTNATGFTSTAAAYTDGGLRVAKDAYISGSTYIAGNLVVYGTSSINYVTASAFIGLEYIDLNTDAPALRFAGIRVFDSGSNVGVTGSLLWDSQNNRWIYSNPSGSSYDSGMLISGPRNSGGVGNEVGTLFNVITKGQGGDHITSSQIYDDGFTVSIPNNLVVTGSIYGGSLTGSLNGSNLVDASVSNAKLTNSSVTINGTSLSLGGTLTQAQTLAGAFSGSAQVNHNATTNYVANEHIDHTTVSISAGNGLSGGGTIAASRTITLDTGSVHFLDGVKKELNTEGVVSSSAQIDHNATTNYVANRHIDHTAVSISAGSGLSGGGDISSTRTISLDTASATFTSGVKSKLNADGVVSSSAQIDHNATTNYSANRHIDHTAVSISAGSGLTGGGDISSTRTLTLDTGSAHFLGGARGAISVSDTTGADGINLTYNSGTGVLSGTLQNSSITVSAGAGMSGGGGVTLGSSVTLTNAGVRSIAAGTGVSVSATTGDNCSISIGQSVATSATVTFDKVITGNNGTAENVRIGDDAWFGDVNTANTVRLKGVQDATAGYLTFGNQTTALGLTNSTTLTWGASFTATGDVTAYSDKRVKENIKTIEGALDKVLKLRGVTYNRVDLDDKTEKIGVIAQEIQEVLPQVVFEENDKLSVAYGNLAGIFIEAIKEQQSQIESLKAEIETLKLKIK